ncbi:MAG TPA: mandelate racemase [Planctomycetaceae bacterium]|nr:mandelate racemase [Planctomycetaceae bacterium]
MQRRVFLHELAALGVSLTAGPLRAARPTKSTSRISRVEIWRLEGHYQRLGPASRQHQVQPLHVYSDHRPAPYREPVDAGPRTVRTQALYLVIGTDDGLEGRYGPIDSEAAVVVDRQLKRFLLGQDALAGEALWDKLYRWNRHSRAGHFMMAISAVDNTLWDLRARRFGVPVYRLLGGPTRPEVEVYGSCLGFSVQPVAAATRAVQFQKKGFRHQKWFLAYGPGDGRAGMEKNVELVRTLRGALGHETDIMFDAFMGWDLNYAMEWVRRVEEYHPRWIEEPFSPEKLESFARLRRATSIPVATGEHFYGRWEVERFLDARAVSVIQADPEWCGGVTELVKICALASANDVHVVPHGHSLHAALHVVASQSPMTCPLVEYLINKMEHYYHFEKAPLQPKDGRIPLPRRPGFGIEWDDAKIEDKRLVTWS